MADEARILEDAEMLGDCGAAHRDLRGEVAHGLGAAPEELEDLPAGRVAEGVERVSVSLHLP
jgi:hypothetical protein